VRAAPVFSPLSLHDALPICAALVFPVSIAVASSTFTGARQARAIGVVLGVQSIGQALGPFVGGTFSEFFSWRGVFFINIPFCVRSEEHTSELQSRSDLVCRL